VNAPWPESYDDWRTSALREPALREPDPAALPGERLLQQVWLHQRLRRDALRTLDGRPLAVLHPGFWNREAGPDFRGAVLQIGDEPAGSGDVEVDLLPQAWRQHGHDRNPAYRQVRLHVVWRHTPNDPCALPTLALADVLDAPLEQLREWLGGESSPGRLTAIQGVCAPRLQSLDDPALASLLEQAALTRLRLKADQIAARARQAGWEQALWEAAFAALGYKHNAWPMRRLAELREHLVAGLEHPASRVREIQARLLGLAGLLPDQLGRRWADTDAWLRGTWDIWWRWRETAGLAVLPRATWRFDGLRPANHPQRRLALAAHWLADPEWTVRIGHWHAAEFPDTRLLPALATTLQAPPDLFWSTHWTLNSQPMRRPQPLLGEPRVTDLAMNAVLPWLWSRAAVAGNTTVQRQLEHRHRVWPAAADNALLRLARQRVLAGRPLPRPIRACHQQGLLQIVRDFCDHSNALCEDCRLPGLLTRP